MTDDPGPFDSLEHVKTVLKLDGIEPPDVDLASLAKLFPSLQLQSRPILRNPDR